MGDHDDDGDLALGAVFTVSGALTPRQVLIDPGYYATRNHLVLLPRILVSPSTHAGLTKLILRLDSLDLTLSGDTICEVPYVSSEM